MNTRKTFVLSGRRDCLAQRRRGAEEFLDRINRVDREYYGVRPHSI